eukprot:s658_g43.t1
MNAAGCFEDLPSCPRGVSHLLMQFFWQQRYASEAAEKVKEIQCEVEDLLLHIRRATDIESKHLEAHREELQQQHAERIKELQAEVRRVRESTDESVERIEAEMQREQAQIEDEVLQKSVERSEALKAIKEEVEDLSALADQEYQKSLEKDKFRHEEARNAMLDMDNQRWRKVEEMDQSCQMLEETQADLAYRVEHLVGEARAARLALHEARERLDARIYGDDVDRQWEDELTQLRQEALKERFDAASMLDQARLKRRELESMSREKSLAGIEECKLLKREHLLTLRRIADELDQMRRNIGLQARDPMLVQSLRELSSKIRHGQMKQQPPKIARSLASMAQDGSSEGNKVEFPSGSGLQRTSLSFVDMGRATLLRQASLLSCPESSYKDKLAQLRKELVERYLDKYGFPSINEPREVGECSRVRMEPLCAIHLAAMKGDPRLLKLLLVEGADPDETFQGYNALDIAEAENQNGSHYDVIEILKDALRAFASWRVQGEAMEALALSVRSKCQRFAAQGLSNVAWSFATSAHFDQTLFEAIAAAAVTRMPELSFQNLSNIGFLDDTA